MKGFRYIFLLANFFLLASCVTAPKQGTAIDKIQAALHQGSTVDQTLASIPSSHAAKNTNVALLPPLGVPMTPAMANTMEKRFDVVVENAPAKSFFAGLVAGTPYNIVVSPDVTGTISLRLKNVTVAEALDAVQDMYGYEYRRTPYGFEILPQTLQTQIFTVNYLDVQRSGKSQVELSSTQISERIGTTNTGGNNSTNNIPSTTNQGISGTQVTTLSKSDFWTNLTTTLTTMVGTDGGRSVVVNPQAGIIVVRAYPKQIREVAAYLDSLQNSLTRQVILEAKILEVTLNDDYQAGINWQLLRLAQNAGATLPVAGTAPSSAQFLTFNAGGKDFNTLINLLEQQGNVQVLSSPRVSTINNQQAVIKVGTDNFFVTSITSNIVPSNGTNSTSSSVGLTPFFSGITLDVTPEISATGEIVLHVHPSVSNVVQQTQQVDLGTQPGSSTDTILKLPLASSSVRESDSVVKAENGQIIVIGGLMQNNTQEQLNSTPGVSRIPFFGTLFRSTTQSSTKSELVILLRAIVSDNNTWPSEMQQEGTNFDELNRGFHVGSRPEVFGTLGEVNN